MSLIGKKGVDISSNNGSIDIAKIKSAGYDFVMIRCGFGENITSQDDNRWEENVRKCEAAGMPWGAYFYSYACSEASAKSELEHALRLLKGKKPTLPVAFDMEDTDGYKAKHGGWNKTNVDRACRIFLEGIAKAGYYPMDIRPSMEVGTKPTLIVPAVSSWKVSPRLATTRCFTQALRR